MGPRSRDCLQAHAGLGQHDDACEHLVKAEEVLADVFGDEYEATGEARFYLALAQLPTATNLALQEEALMKVCGMRAVEYCGP